MGLALLLMVLMVPIVRGARWLACRGIEERDRSGDPRTSVSLRDQSIAVQVEKLGSESMDVGWHVRPRMTADCLQLFGPTLVVGALRRSERRRAVEAPPSVCTWRLSSPTFASCIHLILRRPGGRVRVHDHSVPELPSNSRLDSSRRPSSSPGFYVRRGRR